MATMGNDSLRSSTDDNQGSNIGSGGGGGEFPGAARANGDDPEIDALAQEAFSHFKEAKEYRKNWDKSWDRQLCYFMGQQSVGRGGFRTETSINLIRPIIETIVSHMTDSNPDIQISPCEEAFVESADVIQQVLFRTWQDNEMRIRLNNTIRDTMIYGTSYMKCFMDRVSKKVTVHDLDVRKIYPSPGASDFTDAQYVVFADNIPKKLVEARYPEAKGKLDGGLWDEELTLMKNIVSTKPPSDIPGFYVVPGQYPSNFPKTGGRSVSASKDMVTYIEYWYRDEEDPSDIWVTIAANGVVLYHKKNPYAHKRFPFVKFIDTGLTNTWYGTGEVHHLELTQDSINQRMSQLIELLKLVANPPFLKPASAGIPDNDIANVPGIMLTYQGTVPPQWMQPGQITPEFFTLFKIDEEMMKAISGVYDQTQGQKAKGVTAASGIALVQEISQTIIRPKIRNMESALTQLGEMMLSNIQQFYNEKMIIRVAGRRMNKLGKFIKVNVPALDADNNPTIKNDLSFGKYDVNISVGSEPDFNKAGRYQQMIELKKIMPNVITDKMILESVPDLTQEEVDAALMNTAGPGALPGQPGIPPNKGEVPGGMVPPQPMPPQPIPGPDLAAEAMAQAQPVAAPNLPPAPAQHADFEKKLRNVETRLKSVGR